MRLSVPGREPEMVQECLIRSPFSDWWVPGTLTFNARREGEYEPASLFEASAQWLRISLTWSVAFTWDARIGGNHAPWSLPDQLRPQHHIPVMLAAPAQPWRWRRGLVMLDEFRSNLHDGGITVLATGVDNFDGLPTWCAA